MKLRRFCSWLCLVCLLICCVPSSALADELYDEYGFARQIDTYKVLPLSGSNAISTMEADNIEVQSSLTSVTNTVDFSGCCVYVRSNEGNGYLYEHQIPLSIGGTFSYVVPAGERVDELVLFLHPSASLPSSGTYRVQVDFASDTDLTWSYVYNWMRWTSKNQSNRDSTYRIPSSYTRQSSGDIYFVYNLSLVSNLDAFTYGYVLKDSVSSGGAIGGRFSISFTGGVGSTSDTASPGSSPSSDDIQSSISNTTSQISSRVNDVYDSIQALMQHISNQLAALWDQIYNYCHVPTYNKLQEILLAIKNISMGSDLQKIADQISNTANEQTSDLIDNANSNQEKTEAAIEKHGNFIIDGLKSLFIPSDSYFQGKFDDLYSFLSDKLGFLFLPLELIIDLLNVFSSAGSGSALITLPGFSIMGQTVWTDQQYDLASVFSGDFAFLQQYILLGSRIVLTFAFLDFLRRKYEEVFGSNDS